MTRIEIFYDLVSPYSYLAMEILHRYKPVWQLDLILKPTFIGAIMKESENRPLFTIPNKINYIMKDVKRVGKHYGIPIIFKPEIFLDAVAENKMIPVQRLLTSLSLYHPNYLGPVSRKLFNSLWSEGEDIFSIEFFEKDAQLENMKPEEVASTIAKMDSPEVIRRLKVVTEEAVENGAFGLPVLIVHTELEKHMVFGSDRFPIIADLIGKKWMGPFPNESNL